VLSVVGGGIQRERVRVNQIKSNQIKLFLLFFFF